MKKILCLFLAFTIVICVFCTPRQLDKLTNLKWWLTALDKLSDREIPSLTGDYDFSTFEEGSMSVLYIISYPVRFAYYLVQQIYDFMSFVKDAENVNWVFDGAGGEIIT